MVSEALSPPPPAWLHVTRVIGVLLVLLTVFVSWQLYHNLGIWPGGQAAKGQLPFIVGICFIVGAQHLGETMLHRIVATSVLCLSMLYLGFWLSVHPA